MTFYRDLWRRNHRLERGERKPGRTKELGDRIESSLCFGELRGKLNGWEEDKIWKSDEETKRREEVGGILLKLMKNKERKDKCKWRNLVAKKKEVEKGRRF